MKKSNKGFWIFYVIWTIINVTLLIMAFNDTFGEFDKTSEKFWPFTVGSPRYYDLFELLIYLGVPLAIFLLTKLIHKHNVVINKEAE